MPLGVSERLIEKAYGPIDLSGFYKSIQASANQTMLLEKQQRAQDLKDNALLQAELNKIQKDKVRAIDQPDLNNLHKNIAINQNINKNKNTPYKSKYNFYSDRLIVLMTQLLTINPNITFDIISCYFNDSDFITETNDIKSTLNCQIEYSLDATGNQLDGGNWVLESNNINIQTIYFNSNISQWNNILASPTNYYGTDKGTGKGIYDFFNNYFNFLEKIDG